MLSLCDNISLNLLTINKNGVKAVSGSIFYDFERFDENEFFFALRDGYPVTPLHTLIVPQRHIISYFELNPSERQNLFPFLERQKNKILTEDSTVTAFNIGINDGPDAGRSVHHLHIHLIPRRPGDVENPQGGVRSVIPLKQHYTRKS